MYPTRSRFILEIGLQKIYGWYRVFVRFRFKSFTVSQHILVPSASRNAVWSGVRIVSGRARQPV